MECRLVEAHLSDHLEGTLEASLLAVVDEHLAGCGACRGLRQVLPDVIDALRSAPELAPSATLATRVADAALKARRAERAARWMSFGAPQWMQSAAAGIALVVAGATLYALGPENVARSTSRFVDHALGSGVGVRSRADRVVEDIRVLRVMVGTALEGRLEGVNDRVRDYRRLLQKRRTTPAETSPAAPATPSPSEVGKDGPRSDVADPGVRVAGLIGGAVGPRRSVERAAAWAPEPTDTPKVSEPRRDRTRKNV